MKVLNFYMLLTKCCFYLMIWAVYSENWVVNKLVKFLSSLLVFFQYFVGLNCFNCLVTLIISIKRVNKALYLKKNTISMVYIKVFMVLLYVYLPILYRFPTPLSFAIWILCLKSILSRYKKRCSFFAEIL